MVTTSVGDGSITISVIVMNGIFCCCCIMFMLGLSLVLSLLTLSSFGSSFKDSLTKLRVDLDFLWSVKLSLILSFFGSSFNDSLTKLRVDLDFFLSLILSFLGSLSPFKDSALIRL